MYKPMAYVDIQRSRFYVHSYCFYTCFMLPLAPMCAGLWAECVVAAANSNATAASPLGCNIFSFFIFFLCSVTSEQRRAERYAAAAAAAAAFKPCSQNRLDFYSLINRREAQKWPSAWNPLNGSPHTISRGRFCGNSREKKKLNPISTTTTTAPPVVAPRCDTCCGYVAALSTQLSSSS